MTTKQMFESLLEACKRYIDSILGGYSKGVKDVATFEKENMERYSGGAAIDHVLFRKFLRQFDPKDIENNLARDKQDKVDDDLQTSEKSVVGAINEINKTNEELRKKIEKIKKIAYAGL
jgi:hypothetical protein